MKPLRVVVAWFGVGSLAYGARIVQRVLDAAGVPAHAVPYEPGVGDRDVDVVIAEGALGFPLIEEFSRVPVVLMSAFPEQIERATESGASHTLKLPVENADLVRVVRLAVGPRA
jgi:hypothetical protein